MSYHKKNQGGWVNKLSLWLLLTINIFLLSSLVLHWYTSQEIKNNFNNFSRQVNGELKDFSKIVNQAEKELQGIQQEIKGLTNTIGELNTIEKELKNITTNLAGLNKTGEELKETGENIKGSLDDLGELKEKIDELTKLEIPLAELERTVDRGGGEIAKELKEKIGGIIDKINEFKKVVCFTCFNWNFKINFSPLDNNGNNTVSNSTIEKEKWKELFKAEKLNIHGKVVTVKYSQPRWWSLGLSSTLNREEVPGTKKDVTFSKREVVKEWKDKEESKQDGDKRKEFILQKAYCEDCGRKLELKEFSIKELR